MKILILGGFLGSGKTTFLLKLAEYLTKNVTDNKTPVAVIENEIGEISVDSSVLGNYRVKDIMSGCICCSLAGEIFPAIKEMQEDLNPEYIVIEATGMAYPANIASTIEEYFPESIRTVCLADASRWDELMEYMDIFTSNQLKGSDVILLNKTDLVSAEDTARICKEIEELVPGVDVIPMSAKSEINNMEEILGGK